MEDKSFEVSLNCLFCDSPLAGDTEKELNSGDLIECTECHELNDYDSVREIAIDKGKEQIVEYAKNEIQKSIKKLFK
ncbi:MAG: hypothetical protein CL578_23790 [Alteromonadaceae bacterium]|uniref:hypothetical protein n=1 Tax=Paraglaciecola chathamensis TaxID=368405 RepID=UPI000C3E4B91|nr:hypothetical protein [Paraglaciecola agarilytica]MBN28042.1 hypothetical protein [Alteromonadaceae bacterium]|tara:strand:+ start:55605 stop:55835 length:231 start_codon:yes stop_codon:yes gene_type:complete